jgi:hypothetical protein
MNKPTSPRDDRQPGAKRPYRAPKLRVLGDFRKLTANKGGDKGDGSGKPNTRTNGSPA